MNICACDVYHFNCCPNPIPLNTYERIIKLMAEGKINMGEATLNSVHPGSGKADDNSIGRKLMLNVIELSKKVSALQHQINAINNPTRCECIQKGYEPGLCRKRSVCTKLEKEYHTDKCWERLTASYSFEYLCTCDKGEEENG